MHAGAVVGAVTGGLIGYATHGKKGAIVGAVAGLGVGSLIGHQLDQRRCQLEAIAKKNHLHMAARKITMASTGSHVKGKTKLSPMGLDVQVQDKDGEFAPGSANLTPAGHRYISQIAKLYSPKALARLVPANATTAQRKEIINRRILIVGHVDQEDARSGADLAKLSQRRAKAIAEVFAAHGVPERNIDYQGAGDMLPIAPDSTEQGRKANNRMQIVDVPTPKELRSYVAHRSSTVKHSVVAKHVKHVAVAHRATTRPHASSEHHTLAQHQKRHEQHVVAASRYAFNGHPLSHGYSVSLGASEGKSSSFGFIKTAEASTPVEVHSCLGDQPRSATAIKNLATGAEMKSGPPIPGLYGQPWMGKEGRARVALLHVYAPQDAGAPVPPVKVEFYRTIKGKTQKHPTYVDRKAPVNVYRGQKATLYRVFLKGPAQCVDLYVPRRSPVGHGLLVYRHHNKEYSAVGKYRSIN